MWLRITVSIILIAMFIPILVIIPVSFSTSRYFEFPPPGFSTRWYASILENSEWITGFFHSITVAFFTALLAVTLGTMAALAVRNINFKGKGIYMVLMIAPMVIPVIIIGVSLYYSLAPFGLTNSLLGLVLSHTIITAPLAFVLITSKLSGIDKNLELAAIGLGSTPIGAFFKVTFPLMRSALIASFIFAFITSLDEVIMTIFISGANSKTLPVVIWEQLRVDITPTIAAVATIVIVATVSVYFLQEWFSSRTNKQLGQHK